MAKKMKLNSLLAANRNKGIEKMSDYSNKEQKAASPTPEKKEDIEQLALKQAKEQAHEEATRMKVIATEHETRKGSIKKSHRRGRRRQYTDPRLKALEMQKISARTKIRLQNLIDFKFDNTTPDEMINFLYESYFERELSKDDRNFLNHLEDSSMTDYLQKPKYQKLFQEIELEQKRNH